MGCLSDSMDRPTDLLGHLDAILHQYMYTTLAVAILVVVVFCLQFRRRKQKSTSDAEAWLDDEKESSTLTPDTQAWLEESKLSFEPIPSLASLVSEYSNPLAHALFEGTGIPTSGDLARIKLLNNGNPLNSGDLAAIAPPSRTEDQRHPWRRHSHPQPPPSGGKLSASVTEAVIKEDALEFFRDNQTGKLWRRRTLEFGSMQTP